MATLLSIFQDFCKRQNLTVPTVVMASSDQTIKQARGLLEEEGDDLASRHNWQALQREASWITVAAEDQGIITTIALDDDPGIVDIGFRSIINETIWDRSSGLPVCGPLSPKNWQMLKAMSNTGPRYQYRIRLGRLFITPAPSAGETWYFEYRTKFWMTNAAGTTYKDRFTVDTDIILLPEHLCLAGLRWRWKKEKGLDYAEDFRTYEMQVKAAMDSDGNKPIISMSSQGSIKPGIFVSPRSWPL